MCAKPATSVRVLGRAPKNRKNPYIRIMHPRRLVFGTSVRPGRCHRGSCGPFFSAGFSRKVVARSHAPPPRGRRRRSRRRGPRYELCDFGVEPPAPCHLCRCHRGQAGGICSAGFFDFALCNQIATESRGAHTRNLGIFMCVRHNDSPAQSKMRSKRALKWCSSCLRHARARTCRGMSGIGLWGSGEFSSRNPPARRILRRSALATLILQLLSNQVTAGQIHPEPAATDQERQLHLATRCLWLLER